MLFTLRPYISSSANIVCIKPIYESMLGTSRAEGHTLRCSAKALITSCLDKPTEHKTERIDRNEKITYRNENGILMQI